MKGRGTVEGGWVHFGQGVELGRVSAVVEVGAFVGEGGCGQLDLARPGPIVEEAGGEGAPGTTIGAQGHSRSDQEEERKEEGEECKKRRFHRC